MISRGTRTALVGTILVASVPALAASKVQGRLLSDGVTGRAASPAGWEQENLFVGQLSVGYGAGATGVHRVFGPAGWFSVDGSPGGGWPGGQYKLFSLNFDGRPAFSYTNIDLPAGAAIVDPVNLTTPAHYSVMYNSNEGYTSWGAAPWLWGTDFYQTFVATTPHITRLATKLAGKGGDHQEITINFGVYKSNAGPPSTWQLVSPLRSIWLSGTTDPIIHILWTPYKSSEMNLTVGDTYAARWWRAPNSPSPDFAMVVRTDLNNGYAGGHLYHGSTARTDLDAFGYISGGQDGTIVNHAPISLQFSQPLVGFTTRFGQTFVASGAGLAGVDIVYATGDSAPPALPVTFQLYTAVGGIPIGPSKRCYGVAGFYQADAAAFWSPGEAPMAPGQTYYLEWTTPGFNTWPINENLPGQAYLDRVPLPTKDLAMSIAEYDGPPPAAPVAQFAAAPLSGHVPLNVIFTNQTTGQVFAQDWNFGDSSTSTALNPGHVYTVPGTYTVSLAVNGPGGLDTETKVGYVVVRKNIGDYNDDGDVDQQDFGHLQTCYTGSGNTQSLPACLDARLDDDDDVDLDDFAIFQGCMSGASIPANMNCTP